jgi:hypothetical protein
LPGGAKEIMKILSVVCSLAKIQTGQLPVQLRNLSAFANMLNAEAMKVI